MAIRVVIFHFTRSSARRRDEIKKWTSIQCTRGDKIKIIQYFFPTRIESLREDVLCARRRRNIIFSHYKKSMISILNVLLAIVSPLSKVPWYYHSRPNRCGESTKQFFIQQPKNKVHNLSKKRKKQTI